MLAFLQLPHLWVVPTLGGVLILLVLARKWPGKRSG